jgi:hypothetical protein
MKLVELFEGTLFDCQMIKHLLEKEGIESMLNNEIIGTRGGNVFRPAGGVKIIVSDDNYDKAKMLVDEFEKNQ